MRRSGRAGALQSLQYVLELTWMLFLYEVFSSVDRTGTDT